MSVVTVGRRPDYVRSLGLDAWEVGGAVRDDLLGIPHKDTDFVVPGVGYEELRAALAPHGRVEDLTVNGRHVGVRLHPRDRAVRALAPAGIEFAPPRVERSTGPGRHDFEIVADASIPLAEDMRRRDFTVNAIARGSRPARCSTRSTAGRPRAARPADDEPDELPGRPAADRPRPAARLAARLRARRGHAPPDARGAPQVGLRLGGADRRRPGGGRDGRAVEAPARRRAGTGAARGARHRRARGDPARVRARALGFDQGSRCHESRSTSTTSRRCRPRPTRACRCRPPRAARPRPRQAGIRWRGDDGRVHYYANPELGKRAHEDVGAEIASAVLGRLRYPTALRRRVRRIVQRHMFFPPRQLDPSARGGSCAARRGRSRSTCSRTRRPT